MAVNMMGLIEHFDPHNSQYLLVKFEPSLKRSTITNSRFVVRPEGSSAGVVDDPFCPITVSKDYNSIAKTLKLYWNKDSLDPGTNYVLDVVGLQNAIGIILPSVLGIPFTTPDWSLGEGDDIGCSPHDKSFTIEDYSIRDDIVIDTTAPTIADPGYSTRAFRVVSITPQEDSVYIAEDENGGIVEIEFSQRVDSDSLNEQNFRVQRKKIQMGPARWETVSPVELSQDDSMPVVDIALPSDSGPAFEEGYRYRTVVSKRVRAESEDPDGPVGDSLGDDYEIHYMTVLEPAFLDPDDIMAIFPEADRTAVMGAIHRVSLEIQSIFPGLSADQLPPIAHQYLVAAVACDLSRRFGYGDTDARSITLGDLSVSYETAEGQYSDSGRGVAWCDLAAELRVRLRLGAVGPMKAVVKGARVIRPMPSRSIDDDRKNPYIKGR